MAKKEWMIRGPSEHCGYNSHKVSPGTDLCHWYVGVVMAFKNIKAEEDGEVERLSKKLVEHNVHIVLTGGIEGVEAIRGLLNMRNKNGLTPCKYGLCPQRHSTETCPLVAKAV